MFLLRVHVADDDADPRALLLEQMQTGRQHLGGGIAPSGSQGAPNELADLGVLESEGTGDVAIGGAAVEHAPTNLPSSQTLIWTSLAAGMALL